jgi:tetratricopeptide (TPR) repeat protein
MEDAEWAAFAVPALPFADAEAAGAFLGVAAAEVAERDVVKRAYRRMCLRCHPDRNAAHAAKAHEAFRAVTAALHTLTTANFDYERWSQNFTIPPLQSLEDVLLLALRGADPDEIEAMLRRRGDYRPHREFGINLAIPWGAGEREEPSWEVSDHSEFNTTRQIGLAGGGGASRSDALVVRAAAEVLGERALGASADRPWERVGGVGFGSGGSGKAAKAPVLQLRPDLDSSSPEALGEADRFNDLSVGSFTAAQFMAALGYAREAVRLAPASAVYAANCSAAALKAGRSGEAVQQATRASEMDPLYAKGFLRLAQAQLEQATRESVQEAIGAFAQALELEPGSAAAKRGRREALLTWEADFEDEEE